MANNGHTDVNGKLMAMCCGRIKRGGCGLFGSKATTRSGKDVLLPGNGLEQGTSERVIKDGLARK